ncbi:hypothetical protein [Bradyrhizobium sp. NBAIM01]|nr:hypothetical protein [Bradyrhizobium sp. NBAIM01]MCA1510468.1 hypothetical protein [Bradyrhizobium sp. NBAIM01]
MMRVIDSMWQLQSLGPGSYAVLRLVLEEATRQLGRNVDVSSCDLLKRKP